MWFICINSYPSGKQKLIINYDLFYGNFLGDLYGPSSSRQLFDIGALIMPSFTELRAVRLKPKVKEPVN